MKKNLLLAFSILAFVMALLAGSNPADYDPFHDHPRDTYHLLAQALPQDWTNPNRYGRPFTQPPPGPNAQACRDVWDVGVPCKVDGKFYGAYGELQPEFCDNNFYLPDGRTLKPDAEKCHCNIAMTDADHCPMNDDGSTQHLSIDGSTCLVYCRTDPKSEPQAGGMTHCHCVLQCDSASDDDLMKQPPSSQKKKPAPKKKVRPGA